MARAGSLRHKITFDKRADVDDGYGNTQAGWVEQFTVRGEVRPKLGGETVTAARLQAQNTVTISVRQSDKTRLIREDWRARDLPEGVEYAIKSIVDPDDGGAWLELLCQTGAAA
ncbi:phage head closure protein [Tardiphaga sp.]|jgi:SPP1 family predicted phage head-tail adaptor|uniref:phage head closure protein n=1 Tax=Tardiphaga sp. TaxID=1926292 RepID=UPI0037DA4669